MCASGQTSYDVPHTTSFVHDVLDVEGVATFPVSSAKIRVTGVIRPLYFDDEPIDVEQHLEVINSCDIIRVLERNCKLLKLGRCR